MHVVPITEAPAYDAPGHMQMAMQRLQGMEAGPSGSVWIGRSLLEPGGGTTLAGSDLEKFYICLEGVVQVTAVADGHRQETHLHPLDSCRIAPGEARQLFNPGTTAARLLLVMPQRTSTPPQETSP